MNHGDVKRHEAVVAESGDDMSLAVDAPGIAEKTLDDVHPECLTPLRWRPKEGKKVVLYQRVGPLRPDLALTWAGYAYDEHDDDLVPDYLDPGKVHLISDDGDVVIVLEDATETDIELPTTAAGERRYGPFLRLGSPDATEPLVLGAVYKDWMEDVLDRLIAIADNLESAAATLKASVWAVVGGGGGTASPPAPDIATYSAIETAAGTASNALSNLKDDLPDQLSRYALTSREGPNMEPLP